ncbi:DUF917 domain-containing protein [Anaerosalibacter bizertensis]|uniref:DUF917 domain-containing protein n=1 Tax=Anaerosalibacter bizertensis TaxID=932217 RepID=UPI001D02C704|nr:DUF917 domain-containing protein [Anaerosalibacter bizertensis]MBV1820313.1 DUF917 domain-containing protein [Bacteroidales bacterium MSK.15.36]MCB5559132.1 DUF917 domain-containing protein [Anaerosalibacter bizertensis]
MKKLTKQELHDILIGCTILGTGGGGELDEGIKIIDEDLENGYEFKLVSIDEIPDDAMIASPYNAGSISPLSEEERKKYEGLKEIDEMYNVISFQALEKFMGKKFFATISTELGGQNTAVGFSVAAKLGIPIVDGDPAGRSVPELQQSTFYMNDVSIAPLAVASKFGDVAIISEVVDDFRAEAIVRAIAVASQNTVGVTDHPVLGKNLKKSVIPGAISYALKIGQALRVAKENKKSPAEEIAKACEGYVLFEGIVEGFDWKDEGGFTVGNSYIKGLGEYEENKYKIWFKNENIISWKNDEIFVTVPDLICILDKETGMPITNPNFEKGMNIVAIGLPASEEWRTEKGLMTLGPKHFNYDVEYVPIEEIMK